MSLDALPGIDEPQVIFEELCEIIRSEELNRPRSTHTMIGPSGMGTTCTRWLLHQIAETEEPAAGANWWAWMGTAMHGRLEGVVRADPIQQAGPAPRFLIETDVTVGQVGGKPVIGHVDLYDTLSHTVVDWKSCGKSSTQKFRAAIKRDGHPGSKYRVQLQAYGLGMVLASHPVRQVMNVFLPRNSTRADAFASGEIWFWSEPFDPQIAIDALDRCNGLHDLIKSVGLAAALDMFSAEQCTESHCPWCPRQRREPAAAAKSTTADPFGIGTTEGPA